MMHVRGHRVASLARRVFVLSMAGITIAPAQGEFFRTTLRTSGQDSVHTYRIPGLTTTKAGTLIATFDLRYRSSADLPGDIDVGMMRSTDDGSTWSPMQIILRMAEGREGPHGSGVGDAAVLADRQTGDLFVFGLWSKGDRAWNGSGPGLSPEETGQVVMTRSTDDGLSWSRPVNITRAIAGRDPQWHLVFQGPGKGIQARNGMLMVPMQFRDTTGTPHACFMYSRDTGSTWTLARPAIAGRPPTSESQLVELEDGSLLCTMRNEARDGTRVWSKFLWKEDPQHGVWTEPWYTYPDPTCMAGLERHPSGPVIMTQPGSPRERVALTVRRSHDGGMTWPVSRVIDPRPSAYSCVTILRDGQIGVLYETGEKGAYESLVFARFSMDWLERRE